MPIAGLPMYDWPEIRPATDAFWACLRERLRQAGFVAPEALTRRQDPMTLWTAPDLLLAQSCGYPFATRLMEHVALVGTPAYAIDCARGRYCSIIVARRADAGRSAAELATGCFAFNERDSQSGFQAPARFLATAGIAFPRTTVRTGSHRESIRTVATGRAAFAAIDAVAWQLALAHEPAAGALALIARTPETPGLPFITARKNARACERLADAVGAAIEALDEKSRRSLLLEGFVRTTPADYAPLAEPLVGAIAG